MEMTFSQAISQAIAEEMRLDKKLTLIGEDIGAYGGYFKATKGLFEEFGPERVKDTPISEIALIGTAIGSSILGYKVIVEISYIDFMTISSEQIVNQAAKICYMSGGRLHVPIVVRTQCGAGIRNAAQHSQSLESWFMHIPGLKVVMPSTPNEAKGLLKSSIRDPNPVIFIEHKKLYSIKEAVIEGENTIPLGKASLKKEGKDLTIITYSYMTGVAMEAARELGNSKGMDIEVLDLRTLSPLDKEAVIRSAKKTNNVVVLHEACRQGGVAGEITSIIQEEAFDYLDAPVLRICGPDTPVPYCPDLEDEYILDVADVIEKIKGNF